MTGTRFTQNSLQRTATDVRLPWAEATLDQLGRDYGQSARWAVEAGDDLVEASFSCPNVSMCDGQPYQVPEHAAVVARHLREAVGSQPLVI